MTDLTTLRGPTPTEALPIVVALLRIVYQSFDSGGESARSQRAQALEAALFMIHATDDPAFRAAIAECDADRWAYIAKVRMSEKVALLSAAEAADRARAEALEEAARWHDKMRQDFKDRMKTVARGARRTRLDEYAFIHEQSAAAIRALGKETGQ